jgi:alpha-1,3-mannosyltransferase
VLDLLTTLSQYHTKDCTRYSQPTYAQQVSERYAPLIGHQTPSSSSWFGFGPLDDHQAHLTKIRGDLSGDDHKYFFAINLYNSFDIIPDLFSTLFRVAAILGYHNVFVSIYENGSTDQTKALLRIYDALTRSVGMRVTIRTSQRTRGAFNHRIEYLAEVRNAAFVPLHELREGGNEYFDTIVFMNDVLPCVDDILELIWQSRRNNAGITCAADYMYHDEIVGLSFSIDCHVFTAFFLSQGSPVFYDNWVARDVNGTALENAPFQAIFHNRESNNLFQRHLPIQASHNFGCRFPFLLCLQVQSCWNGIAVLDPVPFYSPPHVRFRMAKITEVRVYVHVFSFMLKLIEF